MFLSVGSHLSFCCSLLTGLLLQLPTMYRKRKCNFKVRSFVLFRCFEDDVSHFKANMAAIVDFFAFLLAKKSSKIVKFK